MRNISSIYSLCDRMFIWWTFVRNSVPNSFHSHHLYEKEDNGLSGKSENISEQWFAILIGRVNGGEGCLETQGCDQKLITDTSSLIGGEKLGHKVCGYPIFIRPMVLWMGIRIMLVYSIVLQWKQYRHINVLLVWIKYWMIYWLVKG